MNEEKQKGEEDVGLRSANPTYIDFTGLRQIAILIGVFIAVNVNFLSSNSYGDMISEDTLNNERIIQIYEEAIKNNEDFKNLVGKIDVDKLREKRKALELYHEEVLVPAYLSMVDILSLEDNIDLLLQYFNLLVSFENSADEGLGVALGKVLFNNPAVVERAFKEYDKKHRDYLYGQLEMGWLNLMAVNKYSGDNPKKIKAEKTLIRIKAFITNVKDTIQ